MVKLIFGYIFLQYISVKFGITVNQLLKIQIKYYPILIGLELFLSVDKKVELINKTLLNIYQDYISNKKMKCDYRQPPRMTDNIEKSLRERYKLTKTFYENGQGKNDREKVL